VPVLTTEQRRVDAMTPRPRIVFLQRLALYNGPMPRWVPIILLLSGGCSLRMTELTTVTPEAPTTADCGACHQKIEQDWRTSSHSMAWQSEAYREWTHDHRVRSCLPCHSPETVFTGGAPPQQRRYSLDEGVNCLACHLHEGAHHGPIETDFYVPHAVVAPDPYYRQAELCGVCHRETLDAWQEQKRQHADQPTCQECHMPEVVDRMGQASEWYSKPIAAAHKKKQIRRHLFSNQPEGVGKVLQFEVRSGPTNTEVVVTNQLPHPLPAGTHGYRAIRLVAELRDLEDQVVTREERLLMRDRKETLAPSAPMSWPLQFGQASGSTLHVWAERLDAQRSARWIIDSHSESLSP